MGNLGKLYVDYSYKSSGSSVKTEAELIETSDGRVSVDFPTSSRQKIYIYTSKDQLKSNIDTALGITSNLYIELISRDKYVQPQDTMFHQLLTEAQNSQFYNELFQTVLGNFQEISYVYIDDI